jgi:hypothetical protein
MRQYQQWMPASAPIDSDSSSNVGEEPSSRRFAQLITLQDRDTLDKQEHHSGTSIVLHTGGFFRAKVIV